MRIQAVIDNDLYEKILKNSKKSGLSISAMTRLALLKFLKPQAKMNAIDEALMDIQNGNIEEVTSKEFDNQIDSLMK